MNNEVKSVKKQNTRSKIKKQVKSNKNKTMARKVSKTKHLLYSKKKLHFYLFFCFRIFHIWIILKVC